MPALFNRYRSQGAILSSNYRSILSSLLRPSAPPPLRPSGLGYRTVNSDHSSLFTLILPLFLSLSPLSLISLFVRTSTSHSIALSVSTHPSNATLHLSVHLSFSILLPLRVICSSLLPSPRSVSQLFIYHSNPLPSFFSLLVC